MTNPEHLLMAQSAALRAALTLAFPGSHIQVEPIKPVIGQATVRYQIVRVMKEGGDIRSTNWAFDVNEDIIDESLMFARMMLCIKELREQS